MAKFQAPPIRTFFLGNPPRDKVSDTMNVPAYAWENWFQSVTNALSSPGAPPTSTSAGLPGQITFDANFLYVAIGKNQWKRIALSAF
jgi:hypothetical protein